MWTQNVKFAPRKNGNNTVYVEGLDVVGPHKSSKPSSHQNILGTGTPCTSAHMTPLDKNGMTAAIRGKLPRRELFPGFFTTRWRVVLVHIFNSFPAARTEPVPFA